MQQVTNAVIGVIMTLVGLVVAAIDAVLGVLRTALEPTGIGRQGENLVLLVVAIAMIVGAVRLFGGILALLISVVLVLIVLHILVPGFGVHA